MELGGAFLFERHSVEICIFYLTAIAVCSGSKDVA